MSRLKEKDRVRFVPLCHAGHAGRHDTQKKEEWHRACPGGLPRGGEAKHDFTSKDYALSLAYEAISMLIMSYIVPYAA